MPTTKQFIVGVRLLKDTRKILIFHEIFETIHFTRSDVSLTLLYHHLHHHSLEPFQTHFLPRYTENIKRLQVHFLFMDMF